MPYLFLISLVASTFALGACQTTRVDSSIKISTNITSTTMTVESKNTATEHDLLADKGVSVPIKVELKKILSIKTDGLAIILPSSTPDMTDEIYYAKKMRNLGLASAIVYGADPRSKSRKYSARYTSSMVLRDLVATISAVNKEYGPAKKIFVMGSSLGSLGIFKTAWTDYRMKFPQLKQINAAFMVNAVCPDSFLGKWDSGIRVYALNGEEDDSTAAFPCKTLAASGTVPNFESLTYPGSHHFESPRFGHEAVVDVPHWITTCSINYTSDLHTQLKRRDGSTFWDTKINGWGPETYKWLYKNCVKRGHLQGYNKKGSEMMWDDVEKAVNTGKI